MNSLFFCRTSPLLYPQAINSLKSYKKPQVLRVAKKIETLQPIKELSVQEALPSKKDEKKSEETSEKKLPDLPKLPWEVKQIQSQQKNPKTPPPLLRDSEFNKLLSKIPPPPKIKKIAQPTKSSPPPVKKNIEPKKELLETEIEPLKAKQEENVIFLSVIDLLIPEEKKTPPPKTFEPTLEKGNVFSLFTNENPIQLFLSLNLNSGNAVKDTLILNASCGENPENCKVAALTKNSEIKNWKVDDSIRTVVIAVDNRGFDTKENRLIGSIVQHFLDQKRVVKIALPRSGDVLVKRTLGELIAQQKGASRCAKVLRSAVPIEHLRDLNPSDEPLERTLQKLVEKRERIATGAHLKEPLEQRIKSAVAIYNKATPLEKFGVVLANLSLRGITHVPENFRETTLLHPDGPNSENQKILDSEGKQTPLIQSLKDTPSLEGKVIFHKEKYWSVVNDTRWKENTTGNNYLVALQLQNCQTKIQVNVIENQIEVDGKPYSEDDFIVCTFKLLTRVIPFFNAQGELTGIQRAFLGHNAMQPAVEKRRNKLAKGHTDIACAILYGSKTPRYKILGEGCEDILSCLEVALANPEAAWKLGLILDDEKSNCQFAASIGVSDLIKAPIEESVKTLYLVFDNDASNMETKQSMIDAVEDFIHRGLIVKIIFPKANAEGKKRDFNDVLIEEGVGGAVNTFTNPIEIKANDDFGPLHVPMQEALEVIWLKQQKQTPQNLFALGKLLVNQEKRAEGFACFKKAFQDADSKLKGELYHEIASLFLLLGRPEKAISFYKLSIANKLNQGAILDDDTVLESFKGLGRSFVASNNFELALSYFGKIFQQKVQKLKSDEHEELSALFFEFGNIDLLQGNLPRALFNFQKALRLKEKAIGGKNSKEIATIIEKIGDVYSQKNRFLDAIGYYKSSQEVLEKVYRRDHHGQDQHLCLKIASNYVELDNFSASLEYFRKGFDLSDDSPFAFKLLIERARSILSKEPKESPKIKPTNVFFSAQFVPLPILKNPNALAINILRERAANVRQVVIDLEMTGSNIEIDRITEIGAVAMLNLKRVGKPFQRYVNPQRSVRPEAYRITGLTQRFLEKHKLFSEIAPEFLDYIDGSDLVFHGSSSDLLFLNQELKKSGFDYRVQDRHRIVDTYDIAKVVFPNEKNSLDALNRRLNLNHEREKHGGLKDAQITADVYTSLLSVQSLLKVREQT